MVKGVQCLRSEGGVRGLTLHLCNLVCNVVSNKMLEIDLDVVATKSCKKDCFTLFFVLTCEFSCFQISFIIGGISTVGIHLCLECYAPARLTRVIAQASLGSPCVSVRLRVLGGWVGILLGTLRVLRNFLGRTWYNKFWKLFYRSLFAWVIFRNLSL